MGILSVSEALFLIPVFWFNISYVQAQNKEMFPFLS